MPNWVTNQMEISGPENVVKLFVESVKTSDDNILDFNKIIPQPAYLFQENLSYEDFRTTNGRNWHDWRVKNWGTKWGAIDATIEELDTLYGEAGYAYNFCTAWSPPLGIFERLAQDFPELLISVRMDEESHSFPRTLIVKKAGETTFTEMPIEDYNPFEEYEEEEMPVNSQEN